MCTGCFIVCILYLNKKVERKKEGRERGERKGKEGRGGEKDEHSIPARPGFQDKVKRPVPRPFCTWWVKGHPHLALTKQNGGTGVGQAPLSLPSHPRQPHWKIEVGPQSHTCWLCDLGHVASLFWASGSLLET